jgi:hypothetical protein
LTEAGVILAQPYTGGCACGAVRYTAMPDLIAVPAASLDQPDRFAPQVLTYSARGLAWDAINPALQAFERMPSS